MMSDYFICCICEKEFTMRFSKDSYPYRITKTKDTKKNNDFMDNLCCSGCFFTYVVPLRVTNNKMVKSKNNTRNKLKIIKGR